VDSSTLILLTVKTDMNAKLNAAGNCREYAATEKLKEEKNVTMEIESLVMDAVRDVELTVAGRVQLLANSAQRTS